LITGVLQLDAAPQKTLDNLVEKPFGSLYKDVDAGSSDWNTAADDFSVACEGKPEL
jgi:hypothetical protein